MLTLYLVRHGLKETIPPLDPVLTPLGVNQQQNILEIFHFKQLLLVL